MFSRWSQENLFRYMRQHYSLDSLVDYRTEAIPETTRVVNPAMINSQRIEITERVRIS